MIEPNGGPAFPVLNLSDGMSLRDYFAAAALTGILAADQGGDRKSDVEVAYYYADLMLRRREITATGIAPAQVPARSDDT
jgi:hypothetical protein